MSRLPLARALSIAGHPFLLTPLTIAIATHNWLWTAVVAACTTLPLTVITWRKVRRGTWSDFDVSRRDQRTSLYAVAAPLLAVTFGLLWWLGASPRLLRGVGAGALMLIPAVAGNRILKTSLHMMFGAFCAVHIARAYPLSLAISIPFLAALAWSRHALGRHTWVEIGVGVVLGVGAGVIAVI
jgi:hypothetical protein